ncbi:MAG: M48 family metallopeptidase [Bacteroidota bacterium]
MSIGKALTAFMVFAVFISFSGCDSTSGGFGGFNLYPVSEDIKLGLQVSKQIESDPAQFPILPEQGNQEIYAYVRGIRDKILNSGQVRFKDTFKWELKIIDDKETLNAFVTPGGYIYVYLGLINFLESEDQLAGVLGHEIAHADRRHSTRQMSQSGLMGTLGQAVLGNESAVQQVVNGLVSLKFSRSHESEADAYSVNYLCGTEYNASGAAGFFRKIENSSGRPPEFLSTHPNPTNRVENIEAKSVELNCTGTTTNQTAYSRIKRLIN